ncbi:S-adenosyl-L-methionine:benzoic acid/salicylic acid carboxyl methyltransferase 2-like [Telopea speciosissima]|uniref:S-adenosyl-L-methionine:benzoic acid/salicylic acid carboxyl methyltransferase 2-like n=1 Tax=Telopea speciosissima TaxID=54955 RepID=UPI001CC5CC28|nr:S-adenosyl-L-methionine:benzoic acid/salicylic acid carboxyl methyltransferase 2-like [Telopea speciosissima]
MAKRVVLESILELYYNTLPQCLCIADLGCSSGPNTLLVITEIINAIESARSRLGNPSLEYQVALNDLPGNDFNTIFKSLPALYEKFKKEKGDQFGPCFISGLPGSFLGRLFPSKSLHFVHSSYSVHWLSQVPLEPEDNKRHIYLAKTSSPSVYKAYLEQFQKDFSVFLRSRYEELVPGGHMVLTILGRKSVDDEFNRDFCSLMELLANSLNDLVSEGLIEEGKVDSFNMPIYTPCPEEVKKIIQKEGLFELEKLEVFDVNWDPNDDNSYNNNNEEEEFKFDNFSSAKNGVRCVRAVTESLLVHNFGEDIMDNLFQRYTKIVADHLSMENAREKSKYVSLLISMKRK